MIRDLIEQYLSEANLMQIATSKGSQPWVATVYYVHDENMNLYFISRRTRRHSIELSNNQNIAGAIVKPHTPGDKVRGIQFEGVASAAQGDDLKRAKELYETKFPKGEKFDLDELADPKSLATYYMIRPRQMVLFDEVNFSDNPRREYILE